VRTAGSVVTDSHGFTPWVDTIKLLFMCSPDRPFTDFSKLFDWHINKNHTPR